MTDNSNHSPSVSHTNIYFGQFRLTSFCSDTILCVKLFKIIIDKLMHMLTSCSAQALIDQIQARKQTFVPIDVMLNLLIRVSPTIQKFWIDPPLAYQGNKVADIDKLSTFKFHTYERSP
jgi:hypothetical protein